MANSENCLSKKIKALKTSHCSELNLCDIDDLISAADIKYISRHFPELSSLIVDYLTFDAPAYLHLFPNLKKLTIYGPHSLGNKDFEPVWQLTQLTHFAIDFYHLDSDFIKSVCRLKKLKSLKLSLCDYIFDYDIQLISKELKELVFLNINGSDCITCQGILNLQILNGLKGLELANVNLWDFKSKANGIEYLSKHEVDCTLESSIAFKALSSFSELNYLSFHGTKITDENLKLISTLKNLKYLNLDKCHHFTECGLSYLAKMANLRMVFLEDCPQITEKILQQLPPTIQIVKSPNNLCWKSIIKQHQLEEESF